MVKVLVLGLNFWPEPTGIGPYTSRMATGLCERGHEVSVVTAFPHYPQWRVQAGWDGCRRLETFEHVAVTRVRHYVPSSPTHLRRAVSEISFGLRLVFLHWGKPDVVLLTSPALISSAMAVGARGRRVRPAFGLVIQDLYSAGLQEATQGSAMVRRALTSLEGRTVRRVDGVAVIHERFKRRVVEQFGVASERVDIIRNWTHLPKVAEMHRPRTRQFLGWRPDETIVLHSGAMGDKQGLMNVVHAARLAEGLGTSIRFVLMGDGSQRARLESAAAGCRAIQFLDPLPVGEFSKAMRAADILLVNERPGLLETAVPSKLTSYFSAGVPVIGATEATSTTAEELMASGAGFRVDPGSPELLVATVLQLGENSDLRAEMGARGLSYCEDVLSEGVALDAYDQWVKRLVSRRGEPQGS